MKRCEVWWVNFDTSVGGEIKKSVLPLSSAMTHQTNSLIEFRLFLLPVKQIVSIPVRRW
jgi:hypothetical protein